MVRPTAAVLAQIPLFTRVSAADRERLIPLSEVREYDRGDIVFHEGDASDFFYVVLTGRIKVFKHGPDGHDIILEMFGPGGPLGAVATFESRPYPASASPVESSSCLLIPRQAFFETATAATPIATTSAATGNNAAAAATNNAAAVPQKTALGLVRPTR